MIETNTDIVTNMTDKERIEYCFLQPENINSLALIVEELFNSKKTNIPEELTNLSNSEISGVFIQAFINIIDKEPTRLKYKTYEFDDFNKLSQIVKIQSEHKKIK